MPKLPPGRDPVHSRHASGQGVVYLSGQGHYTGVWGTAEGHTRYTELVARWNAGGRKPLRKADSGAVTVAELARRFLAAHEGKFQKRGQPTSYHRITRVAVAGLVRLCGSMDAAEVGIDEFETYQAALVRYASKSGKRLARKTINNYCGHVRRLFRWGAAKKLVARPDWVDPKVAEGVRRGRGGRESPGVLPPVPGAVEAVLAVAGPVVADLIRLQLASGCRPGEACVIRPRDLDRSGKVWVYRVAPEWNKTEHHGQDRVVYLGPRAQAVLLPRLEKAKTPDEPLFRAVKKGGPYDRKTYGIQVVRLCGKAGVVPWTPNQLRHARLTEIRRTSGLEASAAVGGHDVEVTKIYAERDADLARRIAEETG